MIAELSTPPGATEPLSDPCRGASNRRGRDLVSHMLSSGRNGARVRVWDAAKSETKAKVESSLEPRWIVVIDGGA